ncbi:MAG: AlpA family transcriptional regulator [Campylobacterales bacterium]|nr:AlpA family transcriptional regulator [Campylobacterales bacterium]
MVRGKKNKFPKPIKLSPKITVWGKDKIKEWIQNKMTRLNH